MSFLTTPQPLVILIAAANLVIFVGCVVSGGRALIPGNVLYAAGAITGQTLASGYYWRLFAYGFLHADPTHLLMNSISLFIMGPHLERRIGQSSFMLIYLTSIVGGGVVSIFAHSTSFLTVGASGALFGLLAALFALWIMGDDGLPASFFFINFLLIFGFSLSSPRIDWAVHFGGFATGFIGVVALDLVSKANVIWLRCRFPEFACVNTLALVIAFAGFLWAQRCGHDADVLVACWLIGLLVLTKTIDLLLAVRRGLVAVAALFVVGNFAAAFLTAATVVDSLEDACLRDWRLAAALDQTAQWLCVHRGHLIVGVACLISIMTAVIYVPQFRRGLRDRGGVAPTFMAERRRRPGI